MQSRVQKPPLVRSDAVGRRPAGAAVPSSAGLAFSHVDAVIGEHTGTLPIRP
ncbi:hypothetical protein ABZY81_35395 [Streptomyces sp. NPDC006514]|uniref:hypothetical protein n=1 Tax=Streptomyces sp. NPDC006514 TaxID=3154308 RepID=UPI0033AA22B7